jgi:hypothetical protein
MPRGQFLLQSLRAIVAPSAHALRLFVAAGLLAAGGVSAQTLSLDNVPPIALSGSSAISAVSIDPSTGNVIVRSSTGTLNSCTSPVAQNATINSFTTNAGTVLPGGAFTLSWSSSNTTSCTPSQGSGTTWPNLGTLSTSGSIGITAPQAQGTTTYQLSCTNGSTSDIRTVNVIVSTGPPPGDCTAISPGSMSEFNSTFGLAWPAYNDKFRQIITNGQYQSLHFTATASQTQFGSITTSGYPDDGDGQGVVSISTVPGCFTASALGANCMSAPGYLFGVSWTNGQSQFACKLTPGGSYYVNVYYPTCSLSNCGRDIGNIQQLLQMQTADKNSH